MHTEDLQTAPDELIKSNDFVNCLETLICFDKQIEDLEQQSRLIRDKITERKQERKKIEGAIMSAFVWSENSSLDIEQEEDIYHDGYLISITTDPDCVGNIVTKPIRSLNEIVE